jgi:hypothetical protein
MKTLRTIYGKVIKVPPGEEITKREADVMSLCSFLKEFMRASKRELSPSPKVTRSTKQCVESASTPAASPRSYPSTSSHVKAASVPVEDKTDPTPSSSATTALLLKEATPTDPTPSTSTAAVGEDNVQKKI